MIASIAAGARNFVREHDLLARSYLAFVALLFLSPYLHVPRNLYYFAVLPCLVLVADRDVLRRLAHSWAVRLSTLLLFCLWLPLFWDDHATIRIVLEFARRAGLIILFVIVTGYLMATVPQFAMRLFRWLAIAGAMASIAALAWWWMRNPILPLTRIGAIPFPNANATAAAYGTVIVGAFCYLFAHGDRAAPGAGSKLKRQTGLWGGLRIGPWIDVGTLVIAALFLALMQSRGALLAVAVASIAALALSRSRAILVGLTAGALLFAVLVVAQVIDPSSLLERGISYRSEIWMHYLGIWEQHPWRGIGTLSIPTFKTADGVLEIVHTHNIYAAHLLLGGIPAFLALATLLTMAMRTSIQRYRETAEPGLIAMLLFVMISGVFDFSIFTEAPGWSWLYFWLPFGLIAGTEASAMRAAQETRPA